MGVESRSGWQVGDIGKEGETEEESQWTRLMYSVRGRIQIVAEVSLLYNKSVAVFYSSRVRNIDLKRSKRCVIANCHSLTSSPRKQTPCHCFHHNRSQLSWCDVTGVGAELGRAPGNLNNHCLRQSPAIWRSTNKKCRSSRPVGLAQPF